MAPKSIRRYVWETWTDNADNADNADGAEALDAEYSISSNEGPSYSTVNPPQRSKTKDGANSNSREKVWDQFPASLSTIDMTDGIKTSLEGGIDVEDQTYFSLTRPVSQPPSSPSSSSSASGIHTAVKELSERVSSMQSELHALTAQAKETQAELLRLRAARDRKTERARVTWAGKMNALQEEQNASLRKQSDFVDKLQGDVKSLRGKLSGLQEQLQLKRADRIVMVDTLEAKAKRQLMQSRRQWEADEKLSLEKLGSARAEAMHKQITASFTGKLERIVAEGKDSLQQKESEMAEKLHLIRVELQKEYDARLDEALRSMRRSVRGEDDRERQRIETRKSDLARKHTDEVNLLKDRFAREEAALIETSERERKAESDITLQSLQRLREAEEKQTAELLLSQETTCHQASVDAQMELSRLTERLEADLMVFEANSEAMRKEKLEGLVTHFKEEILTSLDSEASAIISKMRSDVESETEESQRHAKVELDDLRLRVQSDIDLSAEMEEKAMSRVSILKADVETLRIRATGLRENKERRREEVTELRSRVITLRKDLKDVESSLSRASSDADRLAQATAEHLKGNIREWELRIDDAQQMLERERERLRAERHDVHTLCVDENNRIREKIATVENKKTHAIDLMKRQLNDFRKRNSHLQAELEAGRLKRLEMEN